MTREKILDFGGEIRSTLQSIEKETEAAEMRVRELHEQRQMLGRMAEAIESIVGQDDRPSVCTKY